MIDAKKISLTLKGKKILKDISFKIPKGNLVFFIGKSGSGKTSILKCLGGLHPFEGEISYEGKMGFVFQQFCLFPHMTAFENCIHPLLKVLKWPLSKAKEKATAKLELFGIQEVSNAYPSELSGGQQQRLALARAMCLEPQILLLDEPTAALDPENTEIFVNILKKLENEGVTIIVSTHDLNLLRKTARNIYFIENGAIIESFNSHSEDLQKKTKINRFIGEKYTYPDEVSKIV